MGLTQSPISIPEIDTFRIETGDLDFGPGNVWYVGPNNGDLRVVMDTNGNGQRDDGDEYVTLSGILTGTSFESGHITVGGNFLSDNFSFGDDYIDFVASTDTEPQPETPTEPTSPSDSDDTSMEMTADDAAADGFAPADQAAFDALVCQCAHSGVGSRRILLLLILSLPAVSGSSRTGRPIPVSYTYEKTGTEFGNDWFPTTMTATGVQPVLSSNRPARAPAVIRVVTGRQQP